MSNFKRLFLHHLTPPGMCICMHRYWLETWRRPFAPMHCTIPSGDVMMRCRRGLIGTRRLPMSASTPSDQSWWSQRTYSTRYTKATLNDTTIHHSCNVLPTACCIESLKTGGICIGCLTVGSCITYRVGSCTTYRIGSCKTCSR